MSPNQNHRAASAAKPSALRISERLNEQRPIDARLELSFELRCLGHCKGQLSSGEEVGVQLPRGQMLRDGDLVLVSDGRVVQVRAAKEPVSTARSEDQRLLALASYYLGNRHVALQVGSGWLRYAHDYAIDDMVSGLGLEVFMEHAAFEPEAGADAGHVHDHHHPAPAKDEDYDPGEGP